MRAPKLWWLPLFALAIGAPAVGIMAVSAAGSPADPQASVQGCLDDFGQQAHYLLAEDCLTRVAQQFSANASAGEMIAALAVERHQARIDEGLCHAVTHELGAMEMARLSYDVRSLIDETPALPCTSGVLHGALIAWGETEPELDSRESVAALCRELADGLPAADPSVPYHDFFGMHSDCADGFGHAMWEASRDDPIEAIKRCSVLAEDELIEFCILGVGMQGAEATPSGPPTMSLEEALTVVAPWCEQTRGAQRSGCGAMLAIPFGVSLETLAWRAGDPVSVDTLETEASVAIGHCMSLEQDDLRRFCLKELTSRAMGSFEGQVSWMCPLMPSNYKRECRNLQDRKQQ